MYYSITALQDKKKYKEEIVAGQQAALREVIKNLIPENITLQNEAFEALKPLVYVSLKNAVKMAGPLHGYSPSYVAGTIRFAGIIEEVPDSFFCDWSVFSMAWVQKVSVFVYFYSRVFIFS